MREQEAIGIMTDLSPVDYADLTEPLRRSVMQLHHFSSDGCVVTSAHSAIAAVFPGGSAERVARHIPRRRTTAVHGEALFQEAEDLGLSFDTITTQFVYTEKSIDVTVPVSCTFRKLSIDDRTFVLDHYTLLDEKETVEHLQRGDMIGLEVDGDLAGFTGIHTEGSMGMLYIREDMRRSGYGALLERHLISTLLSEGRIPYCHIIEGNTKSFLLQQKLGLVPSPIPVYWG